MLGVGRMKSVLSCSCYGSGSDEWPEERPTGTNQARPKAGEGLKKWSREATPLFRLAAMYLALRLPTAESFLLLRSSEIHSNICLESHVFVLSVCGGWVVGGGGCRSGFSGPFERLTGCRCALMEGQFAAALQLVAGVFTVVATTGQDGGGLSS